MKNIFQNKIHTQSPEYTYKTWYKILKTYNIRVEIPRPLGEYKKTKSNPLPLKIIPQYYISYNLQGWILAKNRAKG